MNNGNPLRSNPSTTQSLLKDLGWCFSITVGLLLLIVLKSIFLGGLQYTLAGTLLFVLIFTLKFFRILGEVRKIDEQGNSNTPLLGTSLNAPPEKGNVGIKYYEQNGHNGARLLARRLRFVPPEIR